MEFSGGKDDERHENSKKTEEKPRSQHYFSQLRSFLHGSIFDLRKRGERHYEAFHVKVGFFFREEDDFREKIRDSSRAKRDWRNRFFCLMGESERVGDTFPANSMSLGGGFCLLVMIAAQDKIYPYAYFNCRATWLHDTWLVRALQYENFKTV